MSSKFLAVVLLSVMVSSVFAQLPDGIQVKLQTWEGDEEYRDIDPLAGNDEMEFYIIDPGKRKEPKRIEKRDANLKLVKKFGYFPESLKQKFNIEDAIYDWHAYISEDNKVLTVFWRTYGDKRATYRVEYSTSDMKVLSAVELEGSVEEVKAHTYDGISYKNKTDGTLAYAIIDKDDDSKVTEFSFVRYDLQGKVVAELKQKIELNGDVNVRMHDMLDSDAGTVIYATLDAKGVKDEPAVLFSFDPKSNEKMNVMDLGGAFSGHKAFVGAMMFTENGKAFMIGGYQNGGDKEEARRGYYLVNLEVGTARFGKVNYVPFDKGLFDIYNVGGLGGSKKTDPGAANDIAIKSVLTEGDFIYVVSNRETVVNKTLNNSVRSFTERAEILVSEINMNDIADGMLSCGVFRKYESLSYRGTDMRPWVKDGIVYMLRYASEDNLNAKSDKELKSKVVGIGSKQVGIVLTAFSFSGIAKNYKIPELFGKEHMLQIRGWDRGVSPIYYRLDLNGGNRLGNLTKQRYFAKRLMNYNSDILIEPKVITITQK